jgi:hypothetical protein
VGILRNHKDTKTRRQGEHAGAFVHRPRDLPIFLSLLLVWIALYVVTISVGIALPRFFLPLAPVYAIAAAWVIAQLPTTKGETTAQDASRSMPYIAHATVYVSYNAQLIAAMLLMVLLWGGFAAGAGYVLSNQPADEVAAVRLVQGTLHPGERLVVQAPPRISIGKYSAIAHLVAPSNGQYLLALGGAVPVGGTVVGTAGQYTLYRIAP